MGKREHNEDRDYIRWKIKCLEKRLRKSSYSSENSWSDEEDWETRSRTPDSNRAMQYSDYEDEHDHQYMRSTVVIPEQSELQSQSVANTAVNMIGEASTAPPPPPSLPSDILEALGDPKGKPEELGPKIQQEVSERWGRILTEGLNKELKQEVTDKVLIPENFTLAKAPKLNPEISAVLTESARNRDKRLEKAQQQLGVGITGLTNLTLLLIDGDIERISLIKKLSEINQVLLDLHFENTLNRRTLITPLLDKKFLNIVQEVKRDIFLFGESLGDKIKASKTAEKSGLQVKKPENREAGPSKRFIPQSGNWRAPPRQSHRGGRQGGSRNRSNLQTFRRPGQEFDRPHTSSKMGPKLTNKTR